MKIKISILLLLILVISCKKSDEKSKDEKVPSEINEKKETENLTYQQFKGTKWIIGEVGVNGEQPDTLIFNNPKTLVYISTDTGKEDCKYYFVKDTLVYTSYSTEFDLETDDEITCESISKFHYENNTFKYIFCLQKKQTEKDFRCTNMEKHNLVFRKI